RELDSEILPTHYKGKSDGKSFDNNRCKDNGNKSKAKRLDNSCHFDKESNKRCEDGA
ncbi:hypothetical protein Zmor_008779, partial [Zophobas morio]